MSFRRVLAIAGMATIPLWYLYRTAGETRVLRLDRTLFTLEGKPQKKTHDSTKKKADEKAQAERRQAIAALRVLDEKSALELREWRMNYRVGDSTREQCQVAAKSAEFAVETYLRERSSYAAFIDDLRRNPVPAGSPGSPVNEYEFLKAFRRELRELVRDDLVAVHRKNIERSSRLCAVTATEAGGTSGVGTIDALEGERSYFAKERDSMISSRSNLEQVLKLVDDDFPNTLQGKLDRDRALSALYGTADPQR